MCLPLGAVCVAESSGVWPSHRLPKQPGHPPVCSTVDGIAVPATQTYYPGSTNFQQTGSIFVHIQNIIKTNILTKFHED
ncbi:hypothetical protein DPMN_109618 [Dreissena polymorpha]|uniref:Uncharacterized protein n=1 Tax=Dreissena polymorpha TaxID=45954 RepID=A0A9D4QM62_DREPO|nr:hypothetical protein DPMN_109618 [Dreissena polymorpha]